MLSFALFLTLCVPLIAAAEAEVDKAELSNFIASKDPEIHLDFATKIFLGTTEKSLKATLEDTCNDIVAAAKKMILTMFLAAEGMESRLFSPR